MSRINNDDLLHPHQLYALLISAIIGSGILSLARSVSEVTGRDGWISVIIAGFIVLISTYIVILLAREYPNETIIEYSNKLLGNILSKPIALLYFILTVSTSGIVLRVLTYILNTWFLRYTPRWAISVTIISLCIYGSRKGIKVLGRFSFITLILFVPILFLVFVPISPGASLMNIMPVGREGIINILKGVIPGIFSFIGFELILFYFPFLTEKNKITKIGLSAVTTVWLLYSIIVFLELITFPQVIVKKIWLPTVQYISLIKIPFLERLDLIFIYVWVVGIFTTIFINYYTAGIIIQDSFNLKSRKNIYFFLIPIVFFISIYPKGILEIGKYGDIISKIGIITGIIIPGFFLIITKLKPKPQRGDLNE